MTVATNLGSMQTPIGNPQNIYLYTHYNMEMGHFLTLVLPYSLCSLVLVTIAVFVLCKDMKIQHGKEQEQKKISGIRLAVCIVLFVLSLLVVLKVIEYYIVLGIMILAMLIMDRKAFKGVDYTLLITFVFFFVFVGNMGRIEIVYETISKIVEKSPTITAIASSQVISNGAFTVVNIIFLAVLLTLHFIIR